MHLDAPAQREATEAIDALNGAIRGGADLELVLAEYDRTRHVLTRLFRDASLAELDCERYRLADVRDAVSRRMQELFGGLVPSNELTVPGHCGSHDVLFAYLASRVGEAVPAWRVAILTGEQADTRRRVRELRDLGLDLDGFEETFTLRSLEPDLDLGAARALNLRLNARGRKRLRTPEVEQRLAALLGADGDGS